MRADRTRVSLCRAADRGDIVLGWLARVVAILSLLGVLGYDGISLLHARVSVADTADQAAVAARDAWQDTRNAQLAAAAANSVVAESGATIADKGVVIERDGTWRVRVHKTAPTFVLRHLGGLAAVADVTSEGRARPVA